MRRRWLGSGMIVALGCGPGDASVVSASDSSSSGGQPAESSGDDVVVLESSSSSESSVDESSSSAAESSSSTGPSTTCGDANLDDGEACDDGNVDDGDACSSSCTVPFSIAWTQTVDGGDGLEDTGWGAAVADDGTIYVVATVRTLAQSDDLWVRQYAPDGTEGWTIAFDGDESGPQQGRDIVVHASGDVIVVGETEAAATGRDALILRLSADDGSIVWQQTFDGAFDDSAVDFGDAAYSVATEPGGDILVGGRERAEDGSFDMWMRRYDADAVEQWTADDGSIGASEVVEGVGIGVDGVSWMLGSESLENGDYQGWLRGFDDTGAMVSEAQFVGEWMEEMTVAADGELLLCGRTPNAGSWDGLVLRWDPELMTSWTHQHDSADGREDAYFDVASAPSGDIYAVGQEGVMDRGLNADIWVAELSGRDGHAIWGDRFASEQHFNDRARGVAVGSDGAVVVVGSIAEPGEDNNVFIRKYVEP